MVMPPNSDERAAYALGRLTTMMTAHLARADFVLQRVAYGEAILDALLSHSLSVEDRVQPKANSTPSTSYRIPIHTSDVRSLSCIADKISDFNMRLSEVAEAFSDEV